MEYIHIRSLEKYHPGYKDRTLQWGKIHFRMVQGDPDCELIASEIDWARLIKMILLELEAQNPLPNIDTYWLKKGFDLKKRTMSLTLQMLHNFVEVIHKDNDISTDTRHVEENKKEISIKKEINIENKNYSGFEEATVTAWNSFCDKFPILAKIREMSDKRRTSLKHRFMRDSFRDFEKILEAIKEQPFLQGENDRKWVVSFDWIIENDTNYLKILERKYKDKNIGSSLRAQFNLEKR